MRARRAPYSRPVQRAKSRMSCSLKRERELARLWVILRLPRFGQKLRKAPSGSQPLPRTSNASSALKVREHGPNAALTGPSPSWCARGARITCAFLIWKTHYKAALPDGPLSSRSLWGAGPPSPKMAIWLAEICPAGWARSFANAGSLRLPISAANASMPDARITRSALSNALRAIQLKLIW